MRSSAPNRHLTVRSVRTCRVGAKLERQTLDSIPIVSGCPKNGNSLPLSLASTIHNQFHLQPVMEQPKRLLHD